MSQSTQPVVVCGGGLAGLSAAVTALEAGAEVTLIEKSPYLGGTALLSGGTLWTFKEYDKIRELIPAGDPALQWVVHDTLPGARAWLQGLGVKFEDIGQMLHVGHGHVMDPVGAIGLLGARFKAIGGQLHLETGLHSLVMREGVVTGVRALHDGRIHDITAGAVVIATGGFQGNPELLGRYVLREPNNLMLRSNYWSTGDGFIAATQIGAAASPGLNTFYGHALAAPPARVDNTQFREAGQHHGRLCVAINMNGERFADETESTGEEAINQALAHQPGGLCFYVMDDDHMEQMSMQGRGALIRVILARCQKIGATVLQADTLETLCAAMALHGVPEARALATLKDFNAALEGGRADELRPARLGNRKPLRKPPFRAIHVKAAITFTMGGLAVDERARVLWRSGTTSHYAPVPTERAFVDQSAQGEGASTAIGHFYRQMPVQGLYAAGNDVGNISHFAYMGGLASALTMGRNAGRNAATLASVRKRVP
ncbi:MAG: FAD-dependent oxidoreductase [Betaproteobacteria bacterium]|nr:FAD-dependent oxidoreductase [Betaproteobacteria bacterium]